MIEIKTRRVGKYCKLTIQTDNFSSDFGLLDQKELNDVIQDLQDGIDNLTRYLEG